MEKKMENEMETGIIRYANITGFCLLGVQLGSSIKWRAEN